MNIIGKKITVIVDRMLGTRHLKFPDLLYPINYGYVEGIFAADGEEQNVYILGINEPVKKFTGIVVIIIHRFDDVEEKWVAAPENLTFTKAEIAEIVKFQEQFFHFEVIM
ncbi:MAG: inorganic pyrophosphatase [Ruminococcus sp.]|nr:inorganic pyrophosphatase [Ruminococcus sp.]